VISQDAEIAEMSNQDFFDSYSLNTHSRPECAQHKIDGLDKKAEPKLQCVLSNHHFQYVITKTLQFGLKYESSSLGRNGLNLG